MNKQLFNLLGFRVLSKVMKQKNWVGRHYHIEFRDNLVLTTDGVQESVQFPLSQILEILVEFEGFKRISYFRLPFFCI